MSLPSRSLCCLLHHRPQHLNHSPLILVRYPWLCSLLVQVLLIISAPLVLNVITTTLPYILPLVVFPMAVFSALYSSSCTLPLSVLWSLPFSLTTTFMQMTLSSSSLFTHSTLTQAFLTFKTLFNRSLHGWLIILFLTPLRLNSCSSDSKTNNQQYKTLHLTPPTLLEILVSSLTNILPSLTKIHLSSSSKPVTITFVNFAVSDLTSVRQLPVPLLPLSFTPNFITVILSTIDSLSLNYPISSRSRTLSLVLSWKIPNPVISLPSYALFTGSGSLNASKTSCSHLPTTFLQLPNLHAFITSSLFNILALLALQSLVLLGHLHHPL